MKSVMRSNIMQSVIVFAVLTVTTGVYAANYHGNNYPNDLVINAGNPQPWASGDWVFFGSANLVNGVGVWDGTVIVESTGVVTSDRIWIGRASTQTSGRMIIDGGTWTASSVLHLGIRGPDGLGLDEVSFVEIKNGGMMSLDGIEMAEHNGVLAKLIVDGATLINIGAGHLGAGTGNAEVTIRNGGTGNSGFTAMEAGTGHSNLSVDGVGSQWEGHSFYMGSDTRTASLNITGGATVLADEFHCAQGTALCEVTISGAGSSLAPGFDVFIGEVGPARVTIEEGGIFSVGNQGAGLDVSNTGTLIFRVGNGSKIACTGNAVIDDGATIVVNLDSGFSPTFGVPYDLVTAGGTLTVNTGALVLDQSLLPAGITASLSAGSALQVTFAGPPGGNYDGNNDPNDLVINGGNPQPWASADNVFFGSVNKVDGAGVWDGTVIVESTGVVTSDRIWVGSGSPQTSGRVIVDGGTWTSSSVLHLGIQGPDGSGPDEVSLVEIKNGGTLNINGLEVAENGDARLIVDNATLSNVGAGWIGLAGAGDAEVTIRNGGTGDSGFTSLGGAGGTGHSTLNVEGAGSLWTGHSIYMGGSTRTASLNITAGGSVLAEHFYCAQGNAACDVTISGAGSSLDATHDVFIGQVGPAVVTLDEGGIFTVGNLGAGLDVSNTGTLVFGIGNGSKIACTTSAVIDNGATIVVKLDNGFTPTLGVPHDLITASAGLSADINNLVLDISAIGAGYTAELSKTASALQVTLTGPPTGTIFFLE